VAETPRALCPYSQELAMNISPLNNSTLPSTSAQSLVADARQARVVQNSGTTQVQTAQAVEQTQKTEPTRQ